MRSAEIFSPTVNRGRSVGGLRFLEKGKQIEIHFKGQKVLGVTALEPAAGWYEVQRFGNRGGDIYMPDAKQWELGTTKTKLAFGPKGNEAVGAVLLAPSVLGDQLYGITDGTTKVYDRYGFIAPLWFEGDEVSQLNIIMPQRPYMDLGQLTLKG